METAIDRLNALHAAAHAADQGGADLRARARFQEVVDHCWPAIARVLQAAVQFYRAMIANSAQAVVPAIAELQAALNDLEREGWAAVRRLVQSPGPWTVRLPRQTPPATPGGTADAD